jgi:phosphoglycolate phosphatase
MVNSIIWDWNGTIIDDVEYNVSVVNTLLERRNLKTVSTAQYKELRKVPIKHFYMDIGIKIDNEETFNKIIEEYWGIYRKDFKRVKLNNGIKNALNKLNVDGIKNYLLSLTRHEELLEQIKIFDIENEFEMIMGSENSEVKGKVDKAKELIASEKINIRDTLFVGDVINDYEVAGNLGIKCILYLNGHQIIERKDKYNTIERFEDILVYIKEQDKNGVNI